MGKSRKGGNTSQSEANAPGSEANAPGSEANNPRSETLQPKHNFLTSSERRLVAKLHLDARYVMASITAGKHRSVARGSSLEFREHRQYAPGDPLRTLDWKLFGKTDRLYVRQYDDQTGLRVMLLVDQSRSMAYAGSRSGGQSKFDFARRLAAALILLANNQHDPVGLGLFDDQLRECLQPRLKQPHIAQLFGMLARSQPSQTTRTHVALEQLGLRLQRRCGLIVLVSDLLDDPEKMLSALLRMESQGNEVVVFHVLDYDESNFPLTGRLAMHCLEATCPPIRIDASKARLDYLSALSALENRINERLASNNVVVVPCTTNDDLVGLLAGYLRIRAKLPTHGVRRTGRSGGKHS
ncbi:MAG TPA: hypothetical protein DDW52_12960 [Planctomycetaceae bacterium]|nr:hypothetical protein [Planctomycetaceae bacterium]